MTNHTVLRHFPSHTHPLTLVSDPDDVLAEEELLTALSERGFTLIDEPDPVALRHRVEQARPWSIDHPLIVVTDGPLDELPYDLWQQGHHVTLALHTFFPRLAYPIVRTLTPSQRWRLSQAVSPSHRLSQRRTMAFVLRHAFDADIDALREPARLITWLDQIHRQPGPMPTLLVDQLLKHLREIPAYDDWSLETLLTDRAAFAVFVREQWRGYVQQQTGELLGEGSTRYVLNFEADDGLQDTLPGLMRSGTLEAVRVDRPERLPAWSRPAVLSRDEDRRPRRAAELLDVLGEHMQASCDAPPLEEARWERWQRVARAWAELTTLRHDPNQPLKADQQAACQRLEDEIDAAFLGWLRQRYAPLGSRCLPTPHHVHHTPHYIAYRCQQRGRENSRVALLVLDGLALADWYIVGSTWRARHPGWRFDEHLLLAQIPTLTSVSRQALVSGLRPADFADTLDTTRTEARRWAAFWARKGLGEAACPHVHLALERNGPPPEIDSARTRALCLIENTVDDMVHDATLGGATFYASLNVWLEGYSRKLEAVIANLLARGFTVYLTSDHGHVEARGFGRPSEGLTVDTRGKRARIYSDRHAVENVRRDFTETICWHQHGWHQRGLLPDDVWVLMPEGRKAFATDHERVVTHGGPTLDEVVVPLVEIGISERVYG
ncbi:MAG TPA: BREX-3 system phosphatase PglZ [Chloroflexi bacterium]|nr:BREX-3 system phosphatase PglZ [Chloroflexota bacterium]